MIALYILGGVLAFFLIAGLFLDLGIEKNCKSRCIYSHTTVIDGSMHRVCIKCGAEFDADYFEAREGGGNVMQYYRMTKAGKETTK